MEWSKFNANIKDKHAAEVYNLKGLCKNDLACIIYFLLFVFVFH